MKKRRYVGGFGVGEEYLCLVSQLGIFQKIKKSKISKFQKRNMLKLIEALFQIIKKRKRINLLFILF